MDDGNGSDAASPHIEKRGLFGHSLSAAADGPCPFVLFGRYPGV